MGIERVDIDSVTIVGASLSGHATAKALRSLGFTGRLTIIGSEEHRPYDRPPLSKEFLAGHATTDDLWLEGEDEDLDAEWMLGARAIRLDPSTFTVTLADGRDIRSDRVVIATGSTAKRFPSMPAGVYTLRTVDDALALRDELVPGARLVVIGAGFIGLEVASTAATLGLAVTVLGSSSSPLSTLFGDTVGRAVQTMHERHGALVRNETIAVGIEGADRVTGVRLASGEVITADIVVVGIGSSASVDWLAGSGLDMEESGSGGVLCDELGATNADGVFAVGDCAAWFDPVRGRHHRIEHWTDSRDRGAVVAAGVLGLASAARHVRPSYLWSDQCGSRIQFAGRLLGGETVEVRAGGDGSGGLLVVYRRGGGADAPEPVAVLGIDQPKLVAQWRKRLTVTMPGLATSAHSVSVSTSVSTPA